MLDSRRRMPAVLDRHIESEDQDAFGHRHYAQALRCLIEEEGHQPPFSIGLLGGWGTGKSSVKELYTRALADDTSTAGGQRPRSQRFKSITFNAWRFGGKEQDIKRALLRHVFLELGGDEGKLQDDLYRNVTHTTSVPKKIKDLIKEHLFSWAAPLPAFALAFTAYVALVIAGILWLPLDGGIAQGLFVTAVSAVYAYLISVMKPSAVNPFNTITRVHLPSVSAEQYEELLLQQLRKFKPARDNSVPYERLVIFVDDLDRLSAEEMVLGLDAVRTFMEIPTDKLPDNLGLVFVISCDEGKVADALFKRRSNPEQPGSIFSSADARRYLDRIFQFRLEIPPPPRNDMRQFALSKLKSFPKLVTDIADKGASVEQIVDRMIHVNVTDPRNALQIVNAFTQTWWLAKTREFEAIGSARPGGLHEGAVTKHPVALGALSAARVSFPGFYRDLQDDPQLLLRLTNLMVRQTSLNDEPLEAHHVLRRYVTQDGDDIPKLVEGCRDLRQFLASLVGINWPDSLQSLLLLSEDTVTRQYGAHASSIYNKLVSGDTQGFLETLSPRTNDLLSDVEGQLLHNMLSELHRTEQALKFNAMRVVADIIDRVPARTREMVLGILCNDLVTSPELRTILGVEKIDRIVKAANPVDQQHVSAVLIDELLNLEKPGTFGLSTGQPPNIEEAISIAKCAADTVLHVLAAHGLPAQAKLTLMNWLTDRTVTTAKGSLKLPFLDLHKWMDSFESTLLPEIGAAYINQLTSTLQAHEFEEIGAGQDLDTLGAETTVARIDRVWRQMSSEGEDSRNQMWEQVMVACSLYAPEPISCVLNALEQYQASADDEQVLECLRLLCMRVGEVKQAPLDYQRAFELLINIGTLRLSRFKTKHYQAYADLCMRLSEIDGYEHDAATVLKKFVTLNQQALGEIVDQWITAPLEGVPSECRNIVFEAYDHLSEETQDALAKHLTQLTELLALDERDESLYTDAATHIPLSHWGSSVLQAHLDKMLPTLPSKVDEWDTYLKFLLPGLSRIILQTSPIVLGPALQKLVSNAKDYPDVYEELHRMMVNRWPSESVLTSGYSPQAMFNDARLAVTTSPAYVGRHVLASLNSMLANEIVPGSLAATLVETACFVWEQNPEEAVDFLSTSGHELSVEQMANLPNPINFSNPAEVSLLEHVWKAVASNLSIQEELDTTKAVLLKGMDGNTQDPDLALSLWCRALAAEAHGNLKTLLLNANTTDEHRARLFKQIVRAEGGQDQKESQEVLALAIAMFKMPDSPLSWSAVNALRTDINKRLVTHEDRGNFAKQLLNELRTAASDTAKGHMAAWAKSLGTDAVLKDVRPEGLREEDLSIISKFFGDSRTMKGLVTRWKNRK
ncbi:KAP family P-loop NTPase fold protein [Pseudomonas poae]|uniref:NTPase KAP n=1 Tax=Pseudomonas poae TaxID=200451 RepID=A0A2S9EV04_9PSED|nr:P-loop NTPase fold protein [Pseudomonas poae]PRA33657.1 NTPase KAP [Pseudomonas poae]PRC19753.1 NTPase KAP [Pseudomonas poae]